MSQPLAIHVKCRANDPCIFDGSDLFIHIIIENKTAAAVGFPLAFRQKTGPVIRLIDRHTKAETNLRTNLADPALLDQFTTIGPSHSAVLEWVISPSEIEQFGINKIDLDAEITIACKLKVDGKLEDFQGSGTLHIVGKNKL